MNEKIAREIIKAHESGEWECEECFEGSCMDEAKGFLLGLEQGRLKGQEWRKLAMEYRAALKKLVGEVSIADNADAYDNLQPAKGVLSLPLPDSENRGKRAKEEK